MKSDAIEKEGLEWMPKAVWGPIKWKELHSRALLNRSMDKESGWFKEFVAGLPCEKCRNHFKEFLEKYPPNFSCRRAFFAWTVRAHNHVNLATGKGTMGVMKAKRLHQFLPDP